MASHILRRNVYKLISGSPDISLETSSRILTCRLVYGGDGLSPDVVTVAQVSHVVDVLAHVGVDVPRDDDVVIGRRRRRISASLFHRVIVAAVRLWAVSLQHALKQWLTDRRASFGNSCMSSLEDMPWPIIASPFFLY